MLKEASQKHSTAGVNLKAGHLSNCLTNFYEKYQTNFPFFAN